MHISEESSETARLHLADDVLTGEAVRGILQSLKDPAKRRLHLDLSGVRSPSASGLALLRLHKKVRERGGHLVIRNVRPWAYEVFKLTRLTDVLDVRAIKAS